MQEILIDWLQFTIMEVSHFFVIKDILKLDVTLFEELDRGKLGYLKQWRYDNITVCFAGGNEEIDMGVHVILSGQGCRLYETHHPLIELIESINVYKGKLTRIDLALDDKSGEIIKFDRLLADIRAGNVVSKWKTSLEYTKRNLDGKILGSAITVGSRTSNTYLRIYNKALEQGIEDGSVWYRIELEIKKYNAETVQKLINKENVGELMLGILKNYIRIVTPEEGDSNKSRWKNRPYWDKLIKKINKVQLAQKPEEKTIDQLKNWVEYQVGHSLAVIAINDGGELDFLERVITQKAKTLTAKHRRILDSGGE